ncbi:MAG: hypothetical protein ACOCWI_04560, partial [Bacillota bacterium]
MISKSEMKSKQANLGGAPSENIDQNQTPTQNADFDKENQINLTQERLTYICDYCGKVNHIDSPRCARCGKRRPRNEFVKAMTAVREAKLSQQEYEAQKAAQEEEQKNAEQYLQERKQQIMADKEAAQKMSMTRIIEEKIADEKQ